MDLLRDSSLCLDSPSKHSYIGSYYAPPDQSSTQPRIQNQDKSSNNLTNVRRPTVHHTEPDTGSRVVTALKTLQEKMMRLQLERLQAERNAQAARHSSISGNQNSEQSQSRETESSKRKELVSELHSAEARCSLLEKQLEYMRTIVESRQREKSYPVNTEKKNKPTELQIQAQLQKLEEECIKLTNTQSEAERKIKHLERKLLEEEHKRKLLQEKAEELQRELEANMLLSAAEEKPKRNKTKEKLVEKKAVAGSVAKAKRIPFVAGTSTSPSHSVNANVQTVRHLLKTRQRRMCERTQSLPIKKHGGSGGSPRASQLSGDGATALGSLSDVLLALQDELGHLSFEHQELVRQLDETDYRVLGDNLERELDGLVRRMEEKAAQITKLRKHQHAVQNLSQCSPKQKSNQSRAVIADRRRFRVEVVPPVIGPGSPSRPQKPPGPESLQLLRDAQKIQSTLREQGVHWET